MCMVTTRVMNRGIFSRNSLNPVIHHHDKAGDCKEGMDRREIGEVAIII